MKQSNFDSLPAIVELDEKIDAFWNWFATRADEFWEVVNQGENLSEDFFDHLVPELNKVKSDLFFLCGKYDNETVEFIFSAEGRIENFVFVNEIVSKAPQINGWRFTPLKPETPEGHLIKLSETEFSAKNIWFYEDSNPAFPDEINLVFLREDLTETNREMIFNGVFIFLDNFLGERTFAEDIDAIDLLNTNEAKQDLVPVSKLKSFLNWRKKEFVEKFEKCAYDKSEDQYSLLEGTMQSGNPVLCVLNTTAIEWENKASHQWILELSAEYAEDEEGMPTETSSKLLDAIDADVEKHLAPNIDAIFVSRETGDGLRSHSFASCEYAHISKIANAIVMKHREALNLYYRISKDKYWSVFDRFTG